MNTAPIGFFDSGLGGLCIRDAVKALLPKEDTIYIADSANCPYGNRPAEEIVALARRHVATLRAKGCKLIVVACNTATAAAIDVLRAESPDFPFVGMEPAVKVAALHSKTGVVGVLATAGTFNGRLYRETCARFAKQTTVLTCVADEFVQLVERGELEGAKAEAVVRAKVAPLVAAGADHLVLGCTHFPHLTPLIANVAEGRAKIIDPSDAVARQVRRLLVARDALNPAGGTVHEFIRTSKGPEL